MSFALRAQALTLLAGLWFAPASAAAATSTQEAGEGIESPWEVHVQSTLVNQQKNNFRSAYAGANSLRNKSEDGSGNSYTASATAFLGLRLAPSTEFHYNPEVFEGIPFNRQLVGLGGFQNGELQKGAYTQPTFYNARAYFEHTIDLDGGSEFHAGDIYKMSGHLDANRVVINVGKFATLDFFDRNQYSHEARHEFQNFAIFSMAAYSYSADTKGYSYGAVIEWFHQDWILRGARLALPYVPNTQKLDYSLRSDYIDQVELTHRHRVWGQEGAVRALVYRQSAYMGNYDLALQHAGLTQGVPDVTSARQARSTSWGYGFNAEQAITSDWGVFGRISWNPGHLETQTLDVSRSWSVGTVFKGQRWGRAQDTVGLAMAVNGLATSQIAYLQAGGLSPFIGDGGLNYKKEQIWEAYYSYAAQRHLFLTLDVQRIANPAYNSARGPVNVIGVRAHFEM